MLGACAVIRRIFLVPLLVLLVGGMQPTTAAAEPQSPEAYYQGKRISFLIGTSPGSSADILARVIARYLPKYVAGTPTIVPQNMPGAGSITMMNHLYNVSERDGTAMGIVVGGVYMRHLLGAKGIRHDLAKMIPIYNPEGGGAVIYAGSALGLKQPQDIVRVKRQITFGFQNPEGNSAVLGQAGFTMLGVPYRGISGYKGSHEVSLAVERGELDTGWNTPGAYQTLIKPKVEAGIMVPVFQSGLWQPRDNTIVADPAVPDVPTFDALYRQIKGSDPSGTLWDAWFMPLISYARYTIFLPPGVPQPAIDALNTGLENMCADLQFQADIRRIELDPKCYLKEEARIITQRSSTAPPEAVKVLKALVHPQQ